MRAARLALLGLLALPAPVVAATDPLEPANRRIHAFNTVLRVHVLGPAAELWRTHVPPGIRMGLGRTVANLGEPVTALSGLAAGDAALAGHALARFGLNTTLGLGGWHDAAAERGYAPRRMSPGEAACAWGVPSGPYLVLPVLGPTTLRDAGAAFAVTSLIAGGLGAAPVAGWQGADAFLAYDGAHDALSRLDAESLDPYAALRSALQQRRAAHCPQDREEE